MSGPEFYRPPVEPFGPDDPIPANGDGENHPDVIRLRHQLSGSGLGLAEAGKFDALAEHLGGDWTAKRVKAAYAYITSRNGRPK
jgi:hypothetical protein